jgi:hypothetical protein
MFGHRPTPPPKKQSLPQGSGFDRLIQKRADRNNMPGPQNSFGDRILTGPQKNTQSGITGFGGQKFGNPRAGQTFRTGTTNDGRTVHLYGDGQRVVLPKRKAKFKY